MHDQASTTDCLTPSEPGAGTAPSGPEWKLCSECGTPATQRGVPRPTSRLHWRRVWPAAIVLTAFAALLALSALRSQTTTTSLWTEWRKKPPTNACVQPITKADLQAIGRGETPSGDHALSQALLRFNDEDEMFFPGELLDSLTLFVALAPPQGWRYDERSYGLPFAWAKRSDFFHYGNAITRTQRDNEVKSSPGREQGVDIPLMGRILLQVGSMNVHFWPMDGAQPSFTTCWSIDLSAIATSALMLILAGWMTQIAVGATMRIWCRRKRRPLPAGRLAARIAAAIVIIGGATALALWPGQSFEWRRYVRLDDRFDPRMAAKQRMWSCFPTTLNRRQIRELAEVELGEAEIAQAILAALRPLRDVPQDECQLYLCVAFMSADFDVGFEFTYLGWPWGICGNGDLRRLKKDNSGQFIELPWPIQQPSWTVRKGELFIALGAPQTASVARFSVVQITHLSLVILLLWLLWIAARAVCWLIHWRIVRRRRSRGQCAACGYRMQPVPA